MTEEEFKTFCKTWEMIDDILQRLRERKFTEFYDHFRVKDGKIAVYEEGANGEIEWFEDLPYSEIVRMHNRVYGIHAGEEKDGE